MKCTSFSMTWYLSLRPLEALLSTFFRLFFPCTQHAPSVIILSLFCNSLSCNSLLIGMAQYYDLPA